MRSVKRHADPYFYVTAIGPIDGLEYRYSVILLRARFDKNANIKDPLIARRLLVEGEAELERSADLNPYNFPNSPGGKNYGREIHHPDHALDNWPPMEKAQYPTYFNRRNQRKKEYLINWHKRFGKTESFDH
ncbi:hypothetical protein GJ496_000548 [Pomphorhynchus laevis]|nr:hypothetical protein GJ496_000548 [Pomphorhynchus laevis]